MILSKNGGDMYFTQDFFTGRCSLSILWSERLVGGGVDYSGLKKVVKNPSRDEGRTPNVFTEEESVT